VRVLPPTGPGRTFFWAALINMTGTGAYLTAAVLYFVDYVGMPPVRVGLGLTIAGLVALSAGVPVGSLADRIGARVVFASALAVEALATGLLLLIRDYWQFVVLVTVAAMAAAASSAARGPLVRAAGGDRPTELRAYLRSANNLGIALGGAATTGVVAVAGTSGLPVVIFADALSFLLAVLVVLRLPETTPGSPADRPSFGAVFRDRPYAALVLINAVMMQQYPVLTLIIPLWLTQWAGSPRWVVGPLVIINTLMVAFLQVPLSRGADTPTAAARFMIRAAAALLLSFVIIGFTRDRNTVVTVTALAVAVVLLSLGEIWYSVAGTELSFRLAPQEALGQYQGLFSTGGKLGVALSETVAVLLCIRLGTPGWLILGVVVVGASLATVPVTRWALRRADAEVAGAGPPQPPASRAIRSRRSR
jgi:MFS family permease